MLPFLSGWNVTPLITLQLIVNSFPLIFIKHEYVGYHVSNLYFASGVIIRIITIYECLKFDEGRVAVGCFAHLPASQRRNGELWWDGPSDGSGWLVGGWGPRSFRWAPSFVALDAASSDPLEFGVDPVNTWTFCLRLCFFMKGQF